MERTTKSTSINIDANIYRKFKVYCIKKGLTISQMLEIIMWRTMEAEKRKTDSKQ